MSYIHSFPPVSDPHAKVLILGSMPGKVSLKEGEYYAHPRNLFWSLIERILGVRRDSLYPERCKQLNKHGVALWDTLNSCRRSSSLDADIDESSITVNDFPAFFSGHPGLELICFNGARAESIFMKHIAPTVEEWLGELELQRLPSTSPANASVSMEQKIAAWRIIAG